jgi:hypothetical protein
MGKTMSEWVRGRSGWLRERLKTSPPVPQAVPPVPPKEVIEYSVTFTPIKCPHCRSKKIRCYCSQPPIRYHKCIDCDGNFKSVEEP